MTAIQSSPASGSGLLDQPVALAVTRMFVPLLAAYGVTALIGVSDMYFSGLIGCDAQAAVGIGDQVIVLVVMLGTGLATASSSFVSQSCGAGDLARSVLSARHSLTLGLWFGLGSTLVGIGCASELVSLFDVSVAVARQAVPYIQICSLANVPFIICMSIAGTLRAIDRAADSIALWSAVTLISVGGAAFLFICPGPCSRSVLSLALAWVVAAFAGMVSGGFMLARLLPGAVNLKAVSVKELTPLAAVALPAVISELALVLGNVLLYRVMSGMPDCDRIQAAWTVKIKIEQVVALVPLMSLGFATEIIVGHCVGAQLTQRALRALTGIVAFGVAAFFLLGLVVSASAGPLAASLAYDLTSKEAARTLLESSVVVLPALAAIVLSCSGLDGAAMTLVSMKINLLLFALRVGGALLSVRVLDLGLWGLISSGCLASLVVAIIAVAVCRRRLAGAALTAISPSAKDSPGNPGY